ncbi:hypothetical protein KL930_003460 [Ogataea haglerorum]|uniref:PQ-loop-domain-containing protein n=1 Tax=Ogataea haglerorum TaxID=1937702 RepID=A0AAN6D5R5_9ASCO|nr:hypothetical protein KL933_002623 [Ogataea haglerorum]KAG7731036.1 hypothetical protein KL948_003316 [Ogataea haglerorum]KAG7775260.1 hypothetical protein KL930_003460 [Ogataea haglerorum]KAG7778045.1 hypothetical protein KL922_002231 [Ogataea haglerorum]KAG7787820.1 hypothetical protein KL910_003374 [Ogataea haglerorum]
MAPPPSPLIIDAQAVSGITGSISIACWIIVFAPQIYQNFVRSSAEGLSLMFVILWLLGDLFNVVGAILQGVLPTMIVLAIYYTLADVVLLWQCLVYGHGKPKHVDPIHLSPANPLTEHEPLLENVISRGEEDAADTTGDVGSFNDIDGVNMKGLQERSKELFYNLLMVLLVVVSGFGGWFFGGSRDDNSPPPDDDSLVFNPLAQTFGWLCAALYLGSRVPQILLNFERKSCEGISFMFFLFACLGNITYVVSILSVSTGYRYLLVNSSWLAGSLGTLALDFCIFIQFFLYKHEEEPEEFDTDDESAPIASSTRSYDAA